jgi:hypothetical protein
MDNIMNILNYIGAYFHYIMVDQYILLESIVKLSYHIYTRHHFVSN